ncbi:hypothetical protein [Mycoplasma sp. E35C]|uniref:hypothetical protein n=1 Tax=Mycoplasma sp. E35C TaxID=2801918 RepID=UPI001CA3F89B|nr:hypothetical protein [Mycoplasma sp. E35C]QZX49431.1 hypothetical protein JJE79_01645 [Mycoplasma sp. E35C]
MFLYQSKKSELTKLKNAFHDFKRSKTIIVIALVLFIVSAIISFLEPLWNKGNNFSYIKLGWLLTGIAGIIYFVMVIVIISKFSWIYSKVTSAPTLLLIISIFFLPFVFLPIAITFINSSMKEVIKKSEQEIKAMEIWLEQTINSPNEINNKLLNKEELKQEEKAQQ